MQERRNPPTGGFTQLVWAFMKLTAICVGLGVSIGSGVWAYKWITGACHVQQTESRR